MLNLGCAILLGFLLLPALAWAAVPAPSGNVQLKANVPARLFVHDDEVIWRILPQPATEAVRILKGRQVALFLPAGEYQIELAIGTYSARKQVTVAQDVMLELPFDARIGRLKVNSRHAVDWAVYNRQAGNQPVLEQAESSHLSSLVAAGDYEVLAKINNAQQRVPLHVEAGHLAVTDVDVSTGRVNLIATLHNGPALRPMHWQIYRLDGGRQPVADYRRHTGTLDVNPGHYEAVASLDGRERRREFTVMADASSSVVLAMD